MVIAFSFSFLLLSFLPSIQRQFEDTEKLSLLKQRPDPSPRCDHTVPCDFFSLELQRVVDSPHSQSFLVGQEYKPGNLQIDRQGCCH